MVSQFVPRHGPSHANDACRAPGAQKEITMSVRKTAAAAFEALPAILLAAALMMPAFAALA
jgi:hypothetical protein